MAQTDAINNQILALKKQKTQILTNMARIDTQIAALQTQKAQIIKNNVDKGIATESTDELSEDSNTKESKVLKLLNIELNKIRLSYVNKLDDNSRLPLKLKLKRIFECAWEIAHTEDLETEYPKLLNYAKDFINNWYRKNLQYWDKNRNLLQKFEDILVFLTFLPEENEKDQELDEDGEAPIASEPVSTGPDGAINVNTMGDYKYAAKLGELPQRDYLKPKKIKSFGKALNFLKNKWKY